MSKIVIEDADVEKVIIEVEKNCIRIITSDGYADEEYVETVKFQDLPDYIKKLDQTIDLSFSFVKQASQMRGILNAVLQKKNRD